MENYIINSYYKTSLCINKNIVKELKRYTPKGCAFDGYTLFDLLNDFIKMYSWKVNGKISIIDFIKLLQKENYVKAVAYGNAIIKIMEE